MNPGRPASVRFWEKVIRTDTCWLWLGAGHTSGYGRFWLSGRQVQAHRFAYESEVGPIPEGLQLDHLCRVRSCVNPDHLEPVTGRENIARSPLPRGRHFADRTECKHGHAFVGRNVIRRKDGGRECRECVNRRNREADARRRAQ